MADMGVGVGSGTSAGGVGSGGFANQGGAAD